MKKVLIVVSAFLLAGSVVFSQAVKDRQVIPVSVNLNQVLRMTITNGGNIEFVFNSIDDYRDGLSADITTSGSANPATSEGFYQTDFSIASSTRWMLSYGSEEATFIGTDDPGNTLLLNNVGFTLVQNGTGVFAASGETAGTSVGPTHISVPTDNTLEVAALQVYPITLIEDNQDPTLSNAGDKGENDFSLLWRCGTVEAGAVVPMNDHSLLNQNPSPNPDRYVTNVIFELSVD